MSITPVRGWEDSLAGYPVEEGLKGVGFWPRAGARLIDAVAHSVVSFFTGMLFMLMLVVAAGGHVPPLVLLKLHHRGFPGFLFGLLGLFVYNVVLTTVHGSTLGKLALSMVVVQEDGSPCRFKSAVIRELGYFVDALFFGIIAYTAMQGTVQQQRHGDDWAHTVVCKRSLVMPSKLRGGGRFVIALMFALLADSALLMIGLLLKITS